MKLKFNTKGVMKNRKNEVGAISIFVILSMMFFLVAVLGIYSLVSNTNITQSSTIAELKKIYSKESDDIYESKIASSSEEIPIYNENQFLKIGSGDYVEINGKVYEFGEPEDGYNYVLKDNVVLDLVHFKNFYRYNNFMDNLKNSAYNILYYYPVEEFEEDYWSLAYAKNEDNIEQYNIINTLDDNKLYKVLLFYDNQELVIRRTSFNSSFINEIRNDASVSDNCLILFKEEEIVMPSNDSIPNSNITIATNYGTIDVIWLDTDNNVISTPNAPDLYNNSLEKVTWTKSGDTWTEDSTPQSTWYSYNAVTSRNAETNHTDDNNTSMWANAKNPVDGSYFVWIPRYAYRITYYSSETSTDPTGYYDGWGMWKAEDGSVKYALDSGVETVTYNGNKYIVHPAFETNLNNGGWDSDLSGFWVAKYEMSRENYSSGNWVANGTSNYGGGNTAITSSNSSSIRLVSKPSTTSNTVSSWRNIRVGNCYTNAYGYDRDKESHLMKSSEWGAVAYLTHSQYGRNGNEIDINNSTDFLTGNGGGAVGGVASTASGITNYYNTTLGAKASTTGNIYGIYDISGGAWEYTASWDSAAEDSYNYISTYGSSFASKGGASTKYATAYINGTSTNNGSKAYEVSKIGDGIKETLNGRNSKTGWFSDYAYFAFSINPFFIRGGSYHDGAYAGVFCSFSYNGSGVNDCSFRAVLGR